MNQLPPAIVFPQPPREASLKQFYVAETCSGPKVLRRDTVACYQVCDLTMSPKQCGDQRRISRPVSLGIERRTVANQKRSNLALIRVGSRMQGCPPAIVAFVHIRTGLQQCRNQGAFILACLCREAYGKI